MLMKDMFKFRLVNTIACAMFVTYGVFREDNPVIALNALVIIINIVYLIKNKK